MTIKRPLVMRQPLFGKFIYELRLTTRLTQEQFAAALGVTYSTINRWENGRATPSPLALKQIHALFKQLGERGRTLQAKYFSEAE